MLDFEHMLRQSVQDLNGHYTSRVGKIEVRMEGRDEEVLSNLTDMEFQALKALGAKKDEQDTLMHSIDSRGMHLLERFGNKSSKGQFLRWTVGIEGTEGGKPLEHPKNRCFSMTYYRVCAIACALAGVKLQEFLLGSLAQTFVKAKEAK